MNLIVINLIVLSACAVLVVIITWICRKIDTVDWDLTRDNDGDELYECRRCGYTRYFCDDLAVEFRFCPICGGIIRRRDEQEDKKA